MKQYYPLLFLTFICFRFSTAQIICISCYHQNDSISSGVNNLLQNGGFENHNCAPENWFATSYCPNSSYYNCNIANWTCTGGGTSTYADVCDIAYSVIPQGTYAVYFGNYFCNACSGSVSTNDDTSCLINTGCTVGGMPAGYPANPDAAYGGATGLSLAQAATLQVDSVYVLEFWAGGESSSSFYNEGIFGVDVGFGYSMLRCKAATAAGDTGITYIIEFKATAVSQTIKFTNWGHICSSCTELILDNVRLYKLSELSPTVSPCNVPFSANANETDTHCGQCNGIATANPLGGISPFTYLWTDGETTQTISALCADPYTVTITDSVGTAATATVTIAQTGSADSVNVSANQTIMCPSDSAQICATAGFVGYLWNTGDTSRCIYTQLAGNYYVTVTDTASCNAVSNHIAISVYPSPPTSVSVNGDTLTAHGATTYQWFLNGNSIPGATDSVYVASLGGSYTVEVTDTNGCGAVSNAVVISGIAPLSPAEGPGVRIFPNPATNSFTLQTELKNAELTVTDLQGRIVFQSSIVNRQSEINISNWSKGLYFVTVRNNEQEQRGKVVVN